jgi:N utilization substance protein B
MSKNITKNIHFKKSAARLYAIQALFQMEVSKSPLKEITDEFERHRIGASIDESKYNDADLKMFRTIINNAVKQQGRIDKLTDQSLNDSWPLKRIDPTLRAIFRAATSELLIEETPPKAIINEFIDIAKAFFPNGKEAKLVNGVLDNILSLMVKGVDKKA